MFLFVFFQLQLHVDINSDWKVNLKGKVRDDLRRKMSKCISSACGLVKFLNNLSYLLLGETQQENICVLIRFDITVNIKTPADLQKYYSVRFPDFQWKNVWIMNLVNLVTIWGIEINIGLFLLINSHFELNCAID